MGDKTPKVKKRKWPEICKNFKFHFFFCIFWISSFGGTWGLLGLLHAQRWPVWLMRSRQPGEELRAPAHRHRPLSSVMATPFGGSLPSAPGVGAASGGGDGGARHHFPQHGPLPGPAAVVRTAGGGRGGAAPGQLVGPGPLTGWTAPPGNWGPLPSVCSPSPLYLPPWAVICCVTLGWV